MINKSPYVHLSVRLLSTGTMRLGWVTIYEQANHLSL